MPFAFVCLSDVQDEYEDDCGSHGQSCDDEHEEDDEVVNNEKSDDSDEG